MLPVVVKRGEEDEVLTNVGRARFEQVARRGRTVVLVGENAEAGQSVAVFDVPADWCDEDVDRFVQAHSDVWDTAAVVQRRTAVMPA